MLTEKFPNEALGVRKILRRDVKKPNTLPEPEEGHMAGLAWERVHKNDEARRYCPLGLHKKSTLAMPSGAGDFADGECTRAEVRALWYWWDGQTDARAAVRAVWGR